jgi:hypothetical protein
MYRINKKKVLINRNYFHQRLNVIDENEKRFQELKKCNSASSEESPEDLIRVDFFCFIIL